MRVARGVVVAALVVSAAVHLDLAASYARQSEPVSVGALFRLQAAGALLVAFAVLVRRRDRLPLVAAGVVGLVSAAAVVVSVYVRLPAIGLLPEIYEPVWYGEKQLAAAAAAVAALVAVGLLVPRRGSRGTRMSSGRPPGTRSRRGKEGVSKRIHSA